jgi:hypothetical protein
MDTRSRFTTVLSRSLAALYKERSILDNAIRAFELLERFQPRHTGPSSMGSRVNRAKLAPSQEVFRLYALNGGRPASD